MEEDGVANQPDPGVSTAQQEEFLDNTILEAVLGSFMMKKIQEAAREFRKDN
ncbi:MAG: hypothetical protein AAFP85_11785 [Pseudomonadota bacterium]